MMEETGRYDVESQVARGLANQEIFVALDAGGRPLQFRKSSVLL